MVHQHFAETECLRKVWFPSYSQKCFSANEISIFFNRQYFINRWISDFDLWNVDRHEYKEQDLLTGFLKKLLFGEMGLLGPKMAHPHSFGSAVRIFLKFCTIISTWKLY